MLKPPINQKNKDEYEYDLEIFFGDYLERSIGSHSYFRKIEVLEKYVRTTKGRIGSKDEVSNIEMYEDNTMAKELAVMHVQEWIEQDYQLKSEKFIFNFLESDLEKFKNPPKKENPNNAPKILINSQNEDIKAPNVKKPMVRKTPNTSQNAEDSDFKDVLIDVSMDRYSQTSKRSSLVNIVDLTDLQVRSRNNSKDNSIDDANQILGNQKQPEEEKKQGEDFVPGKINAGRLGVSSKEPINVMLAKKWEGQDMDPTNWLMSEKLDGVRGVWTGNNLYSRNKNRFFAPDFFLKGWPNVQLDGELWVARDKFQRTVSYVKKHVPIDEEWEQVVYCVYDCPGLNLPFKQRIERLQEELGKLGSKYIKCHPHIVCTGFGHLTTQLDIVLEKKGEGLMIKNPDSYYQRVRSGELLKVKVMLDDECTVTGHKEGSGRCQGMMGAIFCRLDNGKEFKIGSGFNDAQRRRPPKVGARVTFKYQNLSNDGNPRFPIFVRIKADQDL